MSVVDTPAVTPGTLHGAALEAHSKKLAADQARVVANAPVVSPSGAEPVADAAPDSSDPYEKWVETAPKEYREKYAQSIQNAHANALAAHYGPEVTSLLAEASADPDFRRKLGRLSDKDRRKFLLEAADAVYDAQSGGEPQGNPQLEKIEKSVTELSQHVSAREQQESEQRYIANRQAERDALLAKFPELRWSDPASAPARRLTAVIETAEIASRASGKPVSYAEQYEQMRSMWQEQAANPAPTPIRSQAGSAVPNRQAPKNKVDARAAMNAELQKFGGLSGLAAAYRK